MANKKASWIGTQGFTSSELKLLARCARDPFYFIINFYWVVHPIKGRVHFALYPFQIRALWDFLNNRFNVVLKARQMGLSELLGAYILWLVLFHPYKSVTIISLKDRVAKKLLRRIRFAYSNLPPVLQTPIVNGRPGEVGTASELVFSNGSGIVSVPTSEDAGRSDALSLLVMDEAAIMQYAEVIWASAFPTLATGGSAIVNSTPYGVGGFFYQTWSESLFGGNDFNPIKIHWHHHPDRDIEWYKTMRRSLGAKRTAQEIDCDFLASGDTVFDLADIKAIEEDIQEAPVIESRLNGNFLIFKRPKPDTQFIIGSDVSTGRASDYSSFTVMDEAGDEYAAFKGRLPVNRLRDLLGDTGIEYNKALVAPEANDVGEAVVSGLQERGYPNLYYHIQLVKERRSAKPVQKKVPGWYTTGANRSLIISALEEDIRMGNVHILDPFFTNEAYTFIYDDMNRPVAQNKGEYIGDGSETYADDDIMGKAITNFVRRGKRRALTQTTHPR